MTNDGSEMHLLAGGAGAFPPVDHAYPLQVRQMQALPLAAHIRF